MKANATSKLVNILKTLLKYPYADLWVVYSRVQFLSNPPTIGRCKMTL